MDVAVIAVGGVAAMGAAVGVAFARLRSARLERVMLQQRVLYDSEVQCRPVVDGERHLSEMLDRARKETNELNSTMQRLGDIVMVSRAHKAPLLIRPFVDDIGTVACLMVAPTSDGMLKTVTMETFTRLEVLSTVPGSRDLIAMPPFCKRNYPPSRISAEDLLRRHRAFTCRERDPSTFIQLTNAADVANELQRTHDLILEWRREMTTEELLEKDLRVWLGKRYDSQHARWKKTLAAQMPTARISSERIDAGKR